MIAARGSGVAKLMKKNKQQHHRHHSMQEIEVETSSSSSSDSDSSDEEDQEDCQLISNITKSNKFSLAVATVIMLNVILMGVQADFEDFYVPLQCTTDAVAYRRALISRINELRHEAHEDDRRLVEVGAAGDGEVHLHTLLVQGFPDTDGRSFLNGYYRERVAPEYQLGNHSTFWEFGGQRYIFYCPRVQSWGIGSLTEWEANTEGKCIWGASTNPGANILDPSSGNFTSLFITYEWKAITGAGVVDVIAEAALSTTMTSTATTTATITSSATTTTGQFNSLVNEVEPTLLRSDFSLHIAVAELAQSKGCVDVWQIVNMAFLVFFVFELSFRLITYRWDFFTSEDKWWNVFDFSIVLMGTVDAVIRLVSNGHTNSKLVTIVRVVRILRILRVLRLFRAFKKLTMLIRGLVESFNITFWICLLMLLTMFVYAIFCTTIIGHAADGYEEQNQEEIRMYFGSMLNSTVTLFQFLTLDNWSGITRIVWKHQPLMLPMFLLYVVVVSLVVVSLLTGVMAEHMNTVRESEEALEEQERLKTATKVLYSAFKRVDEDNNKNINFHEFQMVLADQELLDMLKTIELDVGDFDPHELFLCFDKDFDGMLGWDEFRDGMEELRKPVGPKQLFKLQAAMQRVCVHQVQAETVQAASTPSSSPSPKASSRHERVMTPEVEELIGQVNQDMIGVDETLDTFEGDLKEFVTELRKRRKRGTL